jgi:hypothetical protein
MVLVLLATAKPWNIDYAEEELGNALYFYDENVKIERDKKYPLLYVFSSKLDPREAFQIIIREPPAYVERLVPVDKLVSYTLNCTQSKDITRGFLYILSDYLKQKLEKRIVHVEAKARYYYLRCKSKEITEMISSELKKLNYIITRRADKMLKIEDTAYGIVVTLMPTGWDRIRLWREKRLGVGMV